MGRLAGIALVGLSGCAEAGRTAPLPPAPSVMADGGLPSADAGPFEDAMVVPWPTPGSSTASPDAEVSDGGASKGNAPVLPEPPRCVPGTYVGEFQGTLSILGLPLFPLSGSLEIVVDTPDSGDTLRIEDGTLTGTDHDGNPLTGTVAGVLDCQHLELLGGTIRDGVYERVTFGTRVEFEGSVEATYTPGATPSVQGSWRTYSTLERASGTFSAALSPVLP